MNKQLCCIKKKKDTDFPFCHTQIKGGGVQTFALNRLVKGNSNYLDDLFHTELDVFLFSDSSILSVESPSPSIFHITAEADKELTNWLKQQGADSETISKVLTRYTMPSWAFLLLFVFGTLHVLEIILRCSITHPLHCSTFLHCFFSYFFASPFDPEMSFGSYTL